MLRIVVVVGSVGVVIWYLRLISVHALDPVAVLAPAAAGGVVFTFLARMFALLDADRLVRYGAASHDEKAALPELLRRRGRKDKETKAA